MTHFGPMELISHVLRDELDIVVTCSCGREVRPDLLKLRSEMWKRYGGGQDKLSRLRFRCEACGELAEWRTEPR